MKNKIIIRVVVIAGIKNFWGPRKYIPTQDINELQKEVKGFEPMLALDGGEDGFDFYRKIASEYKNYLKDGGYLFAEFGIGQAEKLKELFGETAEVIKDLEGKDRILKVKNV